jgi:hypothetical protein
MAKEMADNMDAPASEEPKIANTARAQLDADRASLLDAAATLFAPVSSSHVPDAVVDLACRFIPADAYAVWRQSTNGGDWMLAAWRGLSERFRTQIQSSSAAAVRADEL